MQDYSIEFGHIYIDQTVGSEQTKSISILQQTITKIQARGESYSTVILIDDFSPDRSVLDIGAYAVSHGKLDFLFLESTLAIFSKRLLSEIDKNKVFESKGKMFLRKSNQENIMLFKENGQPTCHFLIAIWFLARLGIYTEVEKWGINLNKKDFSAKKLITILSEKYKSSDSKAIDIISNTPYYERIDDIDFIYFTL